MIEEVLRRPLDADGNRVFGLPAPSAIGEPTYVDLVSAPQANGTAAPGSSLLAAPADHVHPDSSGGVDYDFILMNDPASPTVSYTATYTGQNLTNETWTNLASALIKTIDYTYTLGMAVTEVRKAYDPTGAVAAQVSFSYNYSGIGPFSTMTRDIGSPGTPSADVLLEGDPVFSDVTYTPTYGSGYVNDELWAFTGSGLTIKTIHYVYNMDLTLGSELRRVYASDGTTIVGQLTITYTYSSGDLVSLQKVRNI